jgi:hypothetical protein
MCFSKMRLIDCVCFFIHGIKFPVLVSAKHELPISPVFPGSFSLDLSFFPGIFPCFISISSWTLWQRNPLKLLPFNPPHPGLSIPRLRFRIGPFSKKLSTVYVGIFPGHFDKHSINYSHSIRLIQGFRSRVSVS